MLHSDDDWLALADTFTAAALGADTWDNALSGLAQGTGSRIGELIGIGSDNTIPFNFITDLGPEWHDEFLAAGGADPRINPFVRVGSQIPALQVRSSAEIIAPAERKRSYYLADFARRHDMQHVCLTPLIKDHNGLVGLAVIRSGRQGEIEARQHELFTSLAPHMRAAVKTQLALEHQGASIVAGALDTLSLTVFVCDRAGVVRAMTAAAESLLSRGDVLRLRHGVLHGWSTGETRSLTDAVALAAGGLARPAAPLSCTLLLRGKRVAPVVLEILPLPRREFAFGFEPRVLVVVRGAGPEAEHVKGMLQLAYHLTAAEIDIALRLADGQPPETIAAARKASIGTVRTQIRSIYTKLGVHRQTELVSRINQLR